MVMSVVPKWESRTWMKVSARNSAATSAVASSHSVRASRCTTKTVPTPATAERPRLIRKNGSQLTGQLPTSSARLWNDPATTPHA